MIPRLALVFLASRTGEFANVGYVTFRFQDVSILSIDDATGKPPAERVTVDFSAVTMEYTPIVNGSPGGTISVGFDFAAGKQI